MARRKYEPAKGVVPLNWKAGMPSEYQMSHIIGEIWNASLPPQYNAPNGADVLLRARLVPFQWDSEGKQYVSVERVPAVYPEAQWRRWASLDIVYRRMSVTLETWK